MTTDPAARRQADHDRQQAALAEQRRLATEGRHEQRPTMIGTPLRDAAVDPRPEDYLAPTNAGEPGPLGDPHGPHVVAPEIPGSIHHRPAAPPDEAA